MAIVDGEVILTKGRTLMTEVTEVLPWTPYFPVAGDHLDVFNALNNIYKIEGEVYAGKVDEIVEIGVYMGREEQALRRGFEDLANYGILEINEEGDFVPTDRYLRHLVGKPVTEPEGNIPHGKERW